MCAHLQQLRLAGLTNTEIGRRRRRGALVELLPAVYCSRRTPTTIDKVHAAAAALPGAVISHRTAAWLHGLLPEPAIVDEPDRGGVSVPHSGA
ncbi:hypothetical protein [uncultured Jatrophihabitans sp.]|uniref:hypothetical protein n=1 Tax=uncultured Jatrophihabitans sp. TaxID=1610747 RepID=UPI0035CB6F3D